MQGLKIVTYGDNRCDQLPKGLRRGIDYRVSTRGSRWSPWKHNGELAGIASHPYRGSIEAIEIKLLDYYLADKSKLACDVKYSAYVQNIGWQPWVQNGETAGTVGQNLRLEAIKIIVQC